MNRLYYADYARSLAIVAVLVIHVSAAIIGNPNIKINGSHWITANVYDSLSRWCVPVFVMVSGALLLNQKGVSTLTFFKKRLSKIMIPLIFWNILYFIFKAITRQDALSIQQFLIEFLSSGTYYHLWFLYMIVGLYLVTPILKVFISQADKKDLEYFLILWFVGNNLIRGIEIITKSTLVIDISMVLGYVGYFLLGYYLNKYKYKTNWPIILFFLGSAIFTIVGTQLLSSIKGGYDGIFYGYLTFNIIVFSGSLYIIILNLFNNKKPGRIISIINKVSLGIYLIHPLFIYLLEKVFKLTVLTFHPIFSVPFISLIVFILSSISIWVIQQIPLFKKLAP